MRQDIFNSIQNTKAKFHRNKENAFKHILPQMYIENLGNVLTIACSVRKKDSEGVWYIIPVVLEWVTEGAVSRDNAWANFVQNLTETMQFYDIDGAKKLRDVDDMEVVRIDKNQEDSVPMYQYLLKSE